MTSPASPGVLGSTFSPAWVESLRPETYAVRPSGDIATPPLRPGNGSVWITSPAPPDPFRSTMRTSLRPRPVERAHRNRPLGVIAPPVGRFPSGVILPAGCKCLPVGWIPVDGPITPTVAAYAAPATSIMVATAISPAVLRGIRPLTDGYSYQGAGARGLHPREARP